MIRTTADAIRALRRHGHLVQSRNPCDGDTWTVASDPDEPGARGAQVVPESIAHDLIRRGMVEVVGPSRFTLTARP